MRDSGTGVHDSVFAAVMGAMIKRILALFEPDSGDIAHGIDITNIVDGAA